MVTLFVFGAVVLAWSLSAFDDHVPLVIPPESAGEADAESVRFRCGAPSGSPSVTPSDAAVEREFALERAPCERTRDERRLVAALDLTVVVVGLLALAFVRGTPRRTGDSPSGDGDGDGEAEPTAAPSSVQ
jgi:hypothetical protein